jgi:hypothetical protein
MNQENSSKTRQTFRWPGVAREIVRAYVRNTQPVEGDDLGSLKALITRIARVSGNPRAACWRFARQSGLCSKRAYQPWTVAEQQRLLDLTATRSVVEVALLLRRSPTSVRSMLYRLGASARMGDDWFTKHSLARALHIRTEQVQKWMDRGWLKSRIVQCGGLRREVIDAEDFCSFCKQHSREVVGYRLNAERLNFVQTFVFPPSHAELLPVRDAKRERAAYEEQMESASARGDDRRDHEDDNRFGSAA